jgi:hypothetical protein
MSTIKISQLPEKATMAGTEEVLINDSGTSKKFSTQRFLDVKSATETARDAALAAQTAAETAETNAETAETNAASSEATATTQATNASTSATNAATSETNAATSASSASGSATAAAASAASAAATYDTFDDRYLGNKASNPTTDNDGDALVQGMLYFNTTDSIMMVYDGSSWITTSSATLSTLDVYKFTATSGQTAFTGTDDDGNTLAIKPTAEMVTLNGIVLESGADYTVTSSTLTLLAGATVSDEVNVYAFGNFELADHYNKVTSDARYAQTVNHYTKTEGDARFEPIDSAYTKAEGDARYLQSVAADSVGASELKVTGNGTAGQYLGSDADGTFTWTSISADPTMGGDLSGTASNAQIVANAVGTTEIANSAVTDAKIAGMSSSKLSGALPAISGAALTGVQPFPSGTKMVFAQASAPTGWTQDTSNNDKALRVVSGSGGGTGGTHAFSSPPSTAHTHSFSDSSSTTSSAGAHSHTGPSHTHTGPSHTHSTPNHSHSHSLSAGAHTLSTSQMPSHKHYNASNYYGQVSSPNNWAQALRYGAGSNGNFVSAAGGSSSHSHSLAGSITSGGSGTSGSGGTGATGAGGTGNTSSASAHTHTVAVSGTSGSAGPSAFAPQYVNVIVATKD